MGIFHSVQVCIAHLALTTSKFWANVTSYLEHIKTHKTTGAFAPERPRFITQVEALALRRIQSMSLANAMGGMKGVACRFVYYPITGRVPKKTTMILGIRLRCSFFISIASVSRKSIMYAVT